MMMTVGSGLVTTHVYVSTVGVHGTMMSMGDYWLMMSDYWLMVSDYWLVVNVHWHVSVHWCMNFSLYNLSFNDNVWLTTVHRHHLTTSIMIFVRITFTAAHI